MNYEQYKAELEKLDKEIGKLRMEKIKLNESFRNNPNNENLIGMCFMDEDGRLLKIVKISDTFIDIVRLNESDLHDGYVPVEDCLYAEYILLSIDPYRTLINEYGLVRIDPEEFNTAFEQSIKGFVSYVDGVKMNER